jgi:hypothetical protein
VTWSIGHTLYVIHVSIANFLLSFSKRWDVSIDAFYMFVQSNFIILSPKVSYQLLNKNVSPFK